MRTIYESASVVLMFPGETPAPALGSERDTNQNTVWDTAKRRQRMKSWTGGEGFCHFIKQSTVQIAFN